MQNTPSTNGQKFHPPASVVIWFVGPAAGALAAWLLRQDGHSKLIDAGPAALFIALPSTLALCSLAIRGVGATNQLGLRLVLPDQDEGWNVHVRPTGEG
ncbi:hypothetical protein CH255_13290 [Rhodococcus sp. 05-2255-2A2]|nr:hypothetical protein CH250_06095 [Rhodococcus sp. 05-2255-3C]OZE18952.1 hypothetical protein CH255_13290 [Rhodococcus sp. 05-2255-2A2]